MGFMKIINEGKKQAFTLYVENQRWWRVGLASAAMFVANIMIEVFYTRHTITLLGSSGRLCFIKRIKKYTSVDGWLHNVFDGDTTT